MFISTLRDSGDAYYGFRACKRNNGIFSKPQLASTPPSFVATTVVQTVENQDESLLARENMAIVSGSCARVNGSRNGPSVSTTPSGSVGQSQPMIAVWEWQDDQGHWRPYSGQVSAHIERCLAPRGHRGGGPGTTSICLGQSDPSLSSYLIDVPSLKQFRQDTGESFRAHLLSVCVYLFVFQPPDRICASKPPRSQAKQ